MWPNFHDLLACGSAIHLGRRRGSGEASKLFVLTTPCPLGFSPFDLPVPETHIAMILTGGCGRNGTSNSIITAAKIYFFLCPAHLPIRQSFVAIKMARRGGCWIRGAGFIKCKSSNEEDEHDCGESSNV